MKKKCFLFILLLLPILVLAEPDSDFVISENTIELGQSIKATVTLTEVSEWDIKIEDTGTSTCSLKEKDRTADNKNSNKTFNLECIGAKEGTMVLKLTGTITNEEGFKKEINNSKTVTVYRVKSGEKNLSVLKVDGKILTDFSAERTEYSLPDTTNKSIRVEANAQDVNATVKGIGNIDLKYGLNIINIVVTAENDETKIYTINITKIDDRDKNNNIKSLTVNNEKVSVDNGTTSYTVKFEHNVKEIVIAAEAVSAKATIKGTGTKKINDYANEFTFTVTAENGDVKTYTVRALRKDKDGNYGKLSDDNKVKNIIVKDYDIKFNPETKKYHVLAVDQDKLELEVVTNDNSATVKIDGNKDFKDGLNEVNIIVTSESGKDNSYLLKVYKVSDATKSVTKTDKNKKEKEVKEDEPKKKTGAFWIWFALIELAILVWIFLTKFDFKQLINNPDEPKEEKKDSLKDIFNRKIKDIKDKLAEYKPVEPVSSPEPKVPPVYPEIKPEEPKEEPKVEQKVVETEIQTEVNENGTKEVKEVPKEESVEETPEEPKEEEKEEKKTSKKEEDKEPEESKEESEEETPEDPMKDISKSINEEINKTILGDKKEEK